MGSSNSHRDGYSYREESRQFRVRLTPEQLERLTAIQRHYKGLGSPSSMEFVLGEGLEVLYDVLEAEGSVPPRV